MPHPHAELTPDIPVLVKHRAGWCIARDGEFKEEALAVATLCGAHVTLPWGMKNGHPDCPECLALASART